jgi:hypothetical protein
MAMFLESSLKTGRAGPYRGFDRSGREPDSQVPGQFSKANSQAHGGLHNLNVHEHTTEAVFLFVKKDRFILPRAVCL